MKLLIVESPAKCAKIQGFLGPGWRVQATMGHIRGLKEGLDAIGLDPTKPPTWSPTYETMKTKAAAIKSLKAAASGAEVYIGSDDDREGEAIGWHVCKVLGLNVTTTPRVIFHEITKEALTKAVITPTRINMAVVEAQQARSMLDMLIGFTLSPCLWKGVGYKPGLSAGRCQTPALRLIYDRDVAIESHQTKLSWVISCFTGPLKWTCPDEFTEETSLKTLTSLKALETLTIVDRKDSVSSHKAPAVFITSSLQQEASSRLGMNPKTCMQLAQKLYEGGHITYMRTDTAIMSAEAVAAARSVVEAQWGAEYLQEVKTNSDKEGNLEADAGPCNPRAEDAGPHEGIRPTHFDVTTVDESMQRLYSLIWKRSMQSVMAPHKEAVVKLSAKADVGPLVYAETRETTFAGWRAVGMPVSEETSDVDDQEGLDVSLMKPGKKVRWSSWTATESRTKALSRYTEASLIRELENKGIGRPSTFATLVETVLDRGYIEKVTKNSVEKIVVKGLELVAGVIKPTKKTEKAPSEKGKLRTTPLGRTVIEWLLSKFDNILDYGFTARMEDQLDEVAAGTATFKDPLDTVWSTYKGQYEEVMKGNSVGSSNSSEKGVLGTTEAGTYKIVVSKKGPLFVLEKDGATFASVPPSLSVQTATLQDAITAFTKNQASLQVGLIDDKPVLKKSGKFGDYLTWAGPSGPLNVPWIDEPFAATEKRFRDKIGSVDHSVGPFKIKSGPYGLYMYRPGKGKPKFVGIPAETVWSTLTVEGAEALYKANA